MSIARTTFIALTTIAIAGCASSVVMLGAIAPDEIAPGEHQSFEQAVPATTASLRMVAVAGDESKGIAPFWISSREVTWDVYDVFLYKLDEDHQPGEGDAITRPSKPYISMDRGFGHGGYPAISMSHKSAMHFCQWLSERTGRHYRLPTVAEWRLVCELGGESLDVDADAWHKGNAEGKTHPVGRKSPNDLGLYDLAGNAAEWATDAEGHGVTLGGSYLNDATSLGCDALATPEKAWNASDPQLPKSVWWYADAPFVGFRVVCTPAPDPEPSDSPPAEEPSTK